MIHSVPWMSIAASVVAGILLGVVYFGGLLLTVHKMPASNHPFAIYFGSMAIRLVLCLFFMYLYLNAYGVLKLLALFATFLLVRIVVATLLGTMRTSALPKGEAAR